MSTHPDIVIIGGGVIGLSVAHRLAGDGLRVRLLERGACGREASWAGAGILSPRSPHRLDAAARLTERSMAQYEAFCGRLLEESGVDPEYRRCGELTLIFDDNDLNIARAEERVVADRATESGQPPIQVFDAADVPTVEPAATTNALGAVLYREAAQVRNPRLLQALHTACTRAGVDIREDCGVEAILTEGERVTGVQTAQDTHPCGRVVLCAGAWSSSLDARLDSLMPVNPVRGQMVLMQMDQPPFPRVISAGKTYLVPRRDGHILLGATEEPDAGFNKRNTAGGISSLIASGLRLVPGLADAAVELTWAGLRPGTPDDKPYLGPVPGFDGLIAATGHFRTGLTLAPVTADIVAHLVAGKDYDIDLTAFRPGRA